ncbi:MAG: phosphoribosylanthranilate isomerase [Synergistaceae bacterium]|nr:phosphoribosylanthranilate isomerase [Synergistaceae bacterium]
MTVRVKFCGLTRICDIDAVNELMPDYAGFVFWKSSRRYITPEKAASFREILRPGIIPVGVFADECPEIIADIAAKRIIDVIQLHGRENNEYISRLKAMTGRTIIKAFTIHDESDISQAEESPADFVMLDSGKGTGKTFDWSLIRGVKRPYFLAGGLDPLNVSEAVKILKPYAVDVSSGIETDGLKDKAKMSAFIEAVRKENIS